MYSENCGCWYKNTPLSVTQSSKTNIHVVITVNNTIILLIWYIKKLNNRSINGVKIITASNFDHIIMLHHSTAYCKFAKSHWLTTAITCDIRRMSFLNAFRFLVKRCSDVILVQMCISFVLVYFRIDVGALTKQLFECIRHLVCCMHHARNTKKFHSGIEWRTFKSSATCV